MTALRFTFAILSSLICISAFLVFLVLRNYPSSMLAALAAIVNITLCILHYLNMRRQLYDHYSLRNLQQFGHFGLVVFATGISTLVYYSVIEILLKTPILPVTLSVIVPIIWALIYLKSGLFLYFYARVYVNQGYDDGLLSAAGLVDEENSPPAPTVAGENQVTNP